MEPTYRLIRSDRRTLAMEISREGELIVRAPKQASEESIRAFVQSHRRWIAKHLTVRPAVVPLSEEERSLLISAAKERIPLLVSQWAAVIDVSYGRVTIRTQKTRWGSCSSKGNLNFNALLMLTPDEVQQYVVVHELCHRLHPNHSSAFWDLVFATYPQAKEARRWLKQHERELIDRIPKDA